MTLPAFLGLGGTRRTTRCVTPGESSRTPRDDRDLPDVSFAFYDGVVIFDHVDKLVHVIQLAIATAPDRVPERVPCRVRAIAGASPRYNNTQALASGRCRAGRSPSSGEQYDA